MRKYVIFDNIEYELLIIEDLTPAQIEFLQNENRCFVQLLEEIEVKTFKDLMG
jgi:hypothetical protein